jgi:tetratricopeptide (TPR) repeat protein
VEPRSRVDELRRRVQKDPASIAFAQLAEELRRQGQFQEAMEICRAGLARHPGYLSARLTLGRSLMALGEVAQAETELAAVLKMAPENLSAIRALAEVRERRSGTGGSSSQRAQRPEYAIPDPGFDDVAGPRGRVDVRPLALEQRRPDVAFALKAGERPSAPKEALAQGAALRTVAGEATARLPDAPTAKLVGILEGWLEAILQERRHRHP